MILTAAAGYTAPPLLGLGGAALLGSGRITLLLWLATILLIAMLVMIRNATAPSRSSSPAAPSWSSPGWRAPRSRRRSPTRWSGSCCWEALRPAFELQAKRRRGGAGDSDADQLSRLTHVPATVWLVMFHVVSLCALTGGGRWLLNL
ncbi:M50 family metallopeptidase [Streptomyces stelliscabiei]